MNFATIKTNDISNGPGVRTSLFVSGCRLQCKGCFNYPAWKFDFGQAFDQGVQESVLQSLMPKHIAGLSVLGGEPLEPENQAGLLPFLREVRQNFADKNIWLFTGYHLEDFLPKGQKYSPEGMLLLELLDVLVDGPFQIQHKKLGLGFRGSSNQRLLNVSASLKEGRAVSI